MNRILFLLLLISLLVVPAAAQDADDGCGPEYYGFMADIVEAMAADIRNGEADVVEALRSELSYFQAICMGLAFEGTTETVIGPVEIPRGVYRAIAHTDGYFIAAIEPLSGDCGGRTHATVLNLGAGDAVTGAEAMARSENCMALIEVSNITAPWTLHFERLG